MNYYEELGIRPDADEEEIRKAHRRLVKLMHPDQHRDQGLKQLAETQMRRLNSIVATLLDPDQREEYDEQLKGGGGENGAGPVPPSGGLRSIPWWIASTAVAIILTVAVVWFWADRYGTGPKGSNPVEVGPEGKSPSAQAETGGQPPAKPDETLVKVVPNTPEPNSGEQSKATGQPTQTPAPPPIQAPPLGTEQHKNPPVESVKTAVPPAAKPKEIPPPPPVTKPAVQQAAAVKNPPATTTKLPSPQAAVQTAGKQVPHQVTPPPMVQIAKVAPPAAVQTAHRKFDGTVLPNQGGNGNREAKGGDINLPAPPTSATQGSREEFASIPSPTVTLPKFPESTKPLVDGHRDPLEGEWVYAPAEPEKRRPGFYPPESIILKLTKQADGMHGQYSARYIIADAKPVSPDVSFSMKAVDKTARKYAWTAADGSRGVAEIRSVEADTMRIEWKLTNQKGNGQVLSSGIATLVRRN